MLRGFIERRVDERVEELLHTRWKKQVENEIICMLETEYNLYEVISSKPFFLAGMLDLSTLKEGDTVTLAIYAKIKADGEFIKHAGFDVTGPVDDPAVLIEPTMFSDSGRITIKQTTGRPRRISYVIMSKDES